MSQTDIDRGPSTAVSHRLLGRLRCRPQHVLSAAADSGVRNLVVITGDRHENHAADLRRDYTDPESPVVAAEFTGTSITSAVTGRHQR